MLLHSNRSHIIRTIVCFVVGCAMLNWCLLANASNAKQHSKTKHSVTKEQAVAKEQDSDPQQQNTFLQQNKKKTGVITLRSGLQYKILKAGKGVAAGPNDYVKVQYQGTFIDGKEFDSSEKNDSPVFEVSDVIPGWREALQLMKPGSEWMLYIPANLAYGKKGISGRIPPNQTLIFKLKVIGVVPPPDSEVTDVLESFDEKN